MQTITQRRQFYKEQSARNNGEHFSERQAKEKISNPRAYDNEITISEYTGLQRYQEFVATLYNVGSDEYGAAAKRFTVDFDNDLVKAQSCFVGIELKALAARRVTDIAAAQIHGKANASAFLSAVKDFNNTAHAESVRMFKDVFNSSPELIETHFINSSLSKVGIRPVEARDAAYEASVTMGAKPVNEYQAAALASLKDLFFYKHQESYKGDAELFAQFVAENVKIPGLNFSPRY